jgi:hypothetical protein
MTAVQELAARQLTLGIGGVRTRFESTDRDLRVRVSFPRTRFVVADETPADCVVRVRLGDADPGGDPPWFASGGPWEVHRGAHGGDRVAFFTALSEGGREAMMRLDLSASLDEGEMTVAPRYAPDGAVSIGFPLDEYLTARLLAHRGAVILHASAVEEASGAYVFVGHSGAGKSTISQIAEGNGARVLSDDRTVLRLHEDQVVACGTPWHGSYASGTPESAVVRGIFLLEQGATNTITPLPRAAAFAELMVRTVRPTAEPAEHLAIVDLVERITATLPVATLRFAPSAAVMDEVRNFVSA